MLGVILEIFQQIDTMDPSAFLANSTLSTWPTSAKAFKTIFSVTFDENPAM